MSTWQWSAVCDGLEAKAGGGGGATVDDHDEFTRWAQAEKMKAFENG